jgi:hypothetical protein
MSGVKRKPRRVKAAKGLDDLIDAPILYDELGKKVRKVVDTVVWEGIDSALRTLRTAIKLRL